jgi:hypothetical protein
MSRGREFWGQRFHCRLCGAKIARVLRSDRDLCSSCEWTIESRFNFAVAATDRKAIDQIFLSPWTTPRKWRLTETRRRMEQDCIISRTSGIRSPHGSRRED